MVPDPQLQQAAFRSPQPSAQSRGRLPEALTAGEVNALTAELNGTMWLVVSLLYGTGMRLLEGLRLRVKDIKFERREISVREVKGDRDRLIVLPENLIVPLRDQLAKTEQLHGCDLQSRFGEAYLPDALVRKHRGAGKLWEWQYVFPSPLRSFDPRSGVERRHHLYPESVECALCEAAHRAAIVKPVSPHVLRHSCAMHMLEAGYDIRSVRERLGSWRAADEETYAGVQAGRMRDGASVESAPTARHVRPSPASLGVQVRLGGLICPLRRRERRVDPFPSGITSNLAVVV